MALSLAHISTTERLRAGKSAIPSILELSTMDVFRWRDDFVGDLFFGGAAPGVYQSTASGTGAATAAISTGVVNGAILLDAGSDDAGRSDLSLGLHFRGDRNAHIWWRAQVSAVTSEKFELGFTDVLSGTDAGAVNVKATPTFRADDAVVICYDTTHNTTLQLLGVKATTAETSVSFNTTIALATDYYFGVELRDDNARGHLLDANGRLIESTTWMDDAVTATVLLTPWAFQQNRSASQRTMTIDLLYAYQRRTTA